MNPYILPKHVTQIIVKGGVIAALVSFLAIECSAHFEVLPLPDDEFQVTFKKEHAQTVQNALQSFGARDDLLGRRILGMHPMSAADADWMYWSPEDGLPLALLLDDGNLLFPCRDSEGSFPGFFFAKTPDRRLLSFA